MGGFIIKVAPARDLYVEWSSMVEAPTRVGTRVEMLRYLSRSSTRGDSDAPEVRLQRADETGTSAKGDYAWCGAWDHAGLVAEQRGVLPRSRLAEYCEHYAADDMEAAYALLEPFEDDGAGGERR
jgi:hypothetical protein